MLPQLTSDGTREAEVSSEETTAMKKSQKQVVDARKGSECVLQFSGGENTSLHTSSSAGIKVTGSTFKASRPQTLIQLERPSDWKAQMIKSALSDIERADYVAIDLEFSGLFRTSTRQHCLEKYFRECAECASGFATVQLGICPAWRATDNDGSNTWRMAPYNFHVFPNDRRVFSADSTTLSWLLENGFSFNEWIVDGFDYAQLAALQNASCTWKRRHPTSVNTEGLQNIIAAIIENEKPLVVHNGLFDILHIHHKFIDELPSDISTFCYEWLRIFVGGIYDTKHIASEGKFSVLQIPNERGTTLCELHHHLHSMKCKSHMVLSPRFFEFNQKPSDSSQVCLPKKDREDLSIPMTGTYSLMPVPTGHIDSKCHEAGYDALITAQVFLMENELYHRVHQTQIDVSIHHIPTTWDESECFGKRFCNFLEFKIAPGKIDVRSIASASSRQTNLSTTQIKATSQNSKILQSESVLSEVNTMGERPRKKRRTEESEGDSPSLLEESSELISQAEDLFQSINANSCHSDFNCTSSDSDNGTKDNEEVSRKKEITLLKFENLKGNKRASIRQKLLETADRRLLELKKTSRVVIENDANTFAQPSAADNFINIDNNSNTLQTSSSTSSCALRMGTSTRSSRCAKDLNNCSNSEAFHSTLVNSQLSMVQPQHRLRHQNMQLRNSPTSTWAAPLRAYISTPVIQPTISKFPQSTNHLSSSATRPSPVSHRRYFAQLPFDSAIVAASSSLGPPQLFPNRVLDLTKSRKQKNRVSSPVKSRATIDSSVVDI